YLEQHPRNRENGESRFWGFPVLRTQAAKEPAQPDCATGNAEGDQDRRVSGIGLEGRQDYREVLVSIVEKILDAEGDRARLLLWNVPAQYRLPNSRQEVRGRQRVDESVRAQRVPGDHLEKKQQHHDGRNEQG